MNKQMLEALRCPKCKGSLTQTPDGLLCQLDGLLYPIRDGLPIMLIEQAQTQTKAVSGGQVG